MSPIRLLAALAVAAPSLAIAQVGPNPSVSGGSLDPNVRGSSDAATAPQDVHIGTEPTIARTVEAPNDTDAAANSSSTSTGSTQVGEGTTETKKTAGSKPKVSSKPR